MNAIVLDEIKYGEMIGEALVDIPKGGRLLLDRIVEVCNGRLTKAEAYGFSDIAIDHVCRFV